MAIDEKTITQLTKAGLRDKAARIYAALLENGGAYPSKLAEITKINRSTTYKVLTNLAVKGLVGEIVKGKKLYYQIEKPYKLERYARYNLSRAQDTLEYTKKLIPELEGLFSLIPNKPQVKYFEGVDGVVSIYEDHLATDKKYEMLAFSNTSEVINFLTSKFIDRYLRAKEKIGIATRAITPDTNTDKNYANKIYKNIDKKIWPVLRHIPKEIFPYKIELTIYADNRVSLLKLEREQPIGVIIEDKTFHDTMQMIFELAWKGASSVSGI
ncbi:MAG: helix-turn-helix domain-containing protein [Parcubacteria group bacterium]|jgi:sugar-specific transcriptional regulator TrmB